MKTPPSFSEVVVVTKPAGSEVTAALVKNGYQVAAITARHLIYIYGGGDELEGAITDAPRETAGEGTRPGRRGAMSVLEAAEALGVSRSYAYELIHDGTLPHLRLGRRIVIPAAALDRLLEGTSP